MIVIVDYGMGNLGSIANMLRKAGAEARIASAADEVARAGKLVLPGVGAFDAGMRNLEERGLLPALRERALGAKVPVLGICLGMQLFCRSSEEGSREGLGWFDARCVRFRFPEGAAPRKVPHMGWNTVAAVRESALFRGMPPVPRFYFVHSFHVVCRDPGDVLATTDYGIPFASAVGRGNLLGVQFHPEKSHSFGMRLLRNFAEAD